MDSNTFHIEPVADEREKFLVAPVALLVFFGLWVGFYILFGGLYWVCSVGKRIGVSVSDGFWSV